jgi:hypothetical protein
MRKNIFKQLGKGLIVNQNMVIQDTEADIKQDSEAHYFHIIREELLSFDLFPNESLGLMLDKMFRAYILTDAYLALDKEEMENFVYEYSKLKDIVHHLDLIKKMAQPTFSNLLNEFKA